MNILESESKLSLYPYQCEEKEDLTTTSQCLMLDDLVLSIFRYFDKQILGRTAQVCHKWKVLSESNFCWKSYFNEAKKTFNILLRVSIRQINYKYEIKKLEENTIKNINQIVLTIQEKYKIDMQEVQISSWARKKDLPVILAKDYENADITTREVYINPVQFSYQDAFECVLNGINTEIKRGNLNCNKSDLCLFHTPFISAITNLKASESAIETFQINDEYVSWYQIIWAALKLEGVVNDYNFPPAGGKTFFTLNKEAHA